MGRRRPRFNQKARASSQNAKHAIAHPRPRDGYGKKDKTLKKKNSAPIIDAIEGDIIDLNNMNNTNQQQNLKKKNEEQEIVQYTEERQMKKENRVKMIEKLS
ncbi:hypothetical protein BCR36DRAFT_397649 [Piromyces finnis]|uniref:Uncharacterized protein n=1 Tax=Piromyces finnis TaxID=1754191 RepID=A0A1Y1V8N7_9FUNG|nr:hypothetical protein BCR36DRAFT_397649 [Piromyces finnis]|eukprot:ORX49993.1 hypothetical protein BCR36DRAFT_397649 [Piromyces finnis]